MITSKLKCCSHVSEIAKSMPKRARQTNELQFSNASISEFLTAGE